ncbi:hypothetical protein LLG39_12045 [bacterium]|nr:hypothetical protein [bacterium]
MADSTEGSSEVAALEMADSGAVSTYGVSLMPISIFFKSQWNTNQRLDVEKSMSNAPPAP